MLLTPLRLQCSLSPLLGRQCFDSFTVGATDLAKVIGSPLGLSLPKYGCDQLGLLHEAERRPVLGGGEVV
jgi:hypothetical protein